MRRRSSRRRSRVRLDPEGAQRPPWDTAPNPRISPDRMKRRVRQEPAAVRAAAGPRAPPSLGRRRVPDGLPGTAHQLSPTTVPSASIQLPTRVDRVPGIRRPMADARSARATQLGTCGWLRVREIQPATVPAALIPPDVPWLRLADGLRIDCGVVAAGQQHARSVPVDTDITPASLMASRSSPPPSRQVAEPSALGPSERATAGVSELEMPAACGTSAADDHAAVVDAPDAYDSPCVGAEIDDRQVLRLPRTRAAFVVRRAGTFPRRQASPELHRLPSLHAVPSVARGFEQMPVAGLQSPGDVTLILRGANDGVATGAGAGLAAVRLRAGVAVVARRTAKSRIAPARRWWARSRCSLLPE